MNVPTRLPSLPVNMAFPAFFLPLRVVLIRCLYGLQYGVCIRQLLRSQSPPCQLCYYLDERLYWSNFGLNSLDVIFSMYLITAGVRDVALCLCIRYSDNSESSPSLRYLESQDE